MKEKDKQVLMVGAGAVALLGLAVYASRGSDAEPINLGGGGGVAGGGMPAVLAGGVDGTGAGTGQAPVTYSVAFPDVKIPAMPAYSIPSDGGTSEPRTSTKKETTMTESETTMTESVQLSTGETQAVNIVAAPGGFHTVAPATTWKGTDAGYTAVTGSKKSETVGADTAPGGLPGLVGGLIGGIGGLFGW